MISLPDPLPNDPDLLKQMLRDAVVGRQADQDTIAQLQEQVSLLRQRLFGRKSEQSWDRYTFGHNSREKAILALLEISQCWRDYEETVTRINPAGAKGNFAANRDRQRSLMRAFPALQIERIEQQLQGTRATPNQPVQLARHIQLTGTYYA